MHTRNNIGFGCAGLSAQPFEKTALKLLQVAFDEGIKHFDTAPIYGQGYSEKILGKFLKEHRNDVTVTTKFGLSTGSSRNIPVWLALPLNQLKKKAAKKTTTKKAFHSPGLLTYRKIEIGEVRTAFEKSIRNLRTDYIDYYLLHEGLPDFLTQEAFDYILSLKQKGYVKKIGIATAYTNFIDIGPHAISRWDILQYENSILHPSESLINRFPDKNHFYHSVLKPLAYQQFPSSLKKELPGILLLKAIKNNPLGITLFSTSRFSNIKNNLKTIDVYNSYSLEALNDIVLNAVH